MKFSSTCIVAVSAFLPQLISAHMRITDPKPYNGEDNAPLAADGSNYPCMMTGAAPQMQAGKTYKAGETGSFKVTGGATHGGGSCQVSITYDNPPTKNSKFKVIKSWVGGCPVASNEQNLSNDRNDGSIPDFSVEIPAELKSGDAVFAWTWFNRIGNREMYMNCAPIKIEGGSDSDSFYESLPDMFKANIGSAGMCTTTEKQDIIFPDSCIGKNVATGKGDCNFKPACEGSGQYSFQPGSSGGVAPPPSENAGNNGGQYSPMPTSPSYTQPTQPALVDGGNNGGVSNSPPSPSYTPINGGGNDSGNNGGNNGGNYGGSPAPAPMPAPAPKEPAPKEPAPKMPAPKEPAPKMPAQPSPPASGGNDSSNGGYNGGNTAAPTEDDNTGRKYGAMCGSGNVPIMCSGAPSGKFIECYGPNMGWAHQLPAGYDGCEDFAKKCGHNQAQKFKRHAFEHAKRFARRHLH